MAGRKKRSDSIAAEVDVARRAQDAISPPPSVPLTKEQLVFFADVIGEAPKSEWTAHQLQLAALLARELWALEREQRQLAEEGVVLTVEGRPMLNPRRSAIQQHASTVLSIRRSLSLHARGKGGEARDLGKRRAAAGKVEAAIAGDGDGLLN